MRRLRDHVSAATSTISSDLLHATYTDFPSDEGWAQVGPQIAVMARWSFGGGPGVPASLPLLSRKWRETTNFVVSISTSMSSIMHAEYCLVPAEFRREPCGMTHVGIRAASTISSVATTDTEDGTISPCRLKLTS